MTATYNIDAEFGVLGACLTNNLNYYRIHWLEPEDFYEPVHGRIWSSIRQHIAEGRNANPMTMRPLFDTDATLVDLGGGGYLVKLAAQATAIFDVVETAQHIRTLSKRRAIAAACALAMRQVEDKEGEHLGVEEIATTLSATLQAISTTSQRLRGVSDVELTQRVIEALKSQPPVTSTGMNKLDEAMGGGLHAGKAYGFCARKKVGKTILVSTLSANLARAGVRHSVICAEMGTSEVHQRVLARYMQCRPGSFTGNYRNTDKFQERLSEAAQAMQGYAIYHNIPGIKFDELRDVVSAAVRVHGIKGFFLDYWQLVGGKPPRQSVVEHLDNVAQWVADTARQYGIWAIVAGQLNQDGNTRGGEGMRLAFDQVYAIHRPDTSAPQTWVEMMDTRYTPWCNIGSENTPRWHLNEFGPYFQEMY